MKKKDGVGVINAIAIAVIAAAAVRTAIAATAAAAAVIPAAAIDKKKSREFLLKISRLFFYNDF